MVGLVLFLLGGREGRVATDEAVSTKHFIGSTQWETGSRQLMRGGSPTDLTALDERLVAYLVDHRGRTVSHAELLQEVWTYSERAQTRAVVHAVRRLRTKLGADAAQLVTVYGVGYRLEPAESDLVGREAEVARVCRALDRQRLVTLYGVGGIGKSRVAEAVMQATGAAGPGCWVPCRGLDSEQDLIVATCGALELGAPESEDRLLTALRHRERCLVVFDAAEHLGAVDGFAQRLVGGAETTRVLVTSRNAAAGGTAIRIDPLPRRDARRLFLRRAAAAAPGIELDPKHVSTILDLVEGVPLSLEVAAGRLRVQELPSLIRELRAAERPRLGLSDVLDRAWAHASADERRVWIAASQFPVSCTLGQLARVTGLEGDALWAAVEGLTRAGLVLGRDPRLRQLDQVSAFARPLTPPDLRAAFLGWAVDAAREMYTRANIRRPMTDQDTISVSAAVREALHDPLPTEERTHVLLAMVVRNTVPNPNNSLRRELAALDLDKLPTTLAIDVALARGHAAFRAGEWSAAEADADEAMARAGEHGTADQLALARIHRMRARQQLLGYDASAGECDALVEAFEREGAPDRWRAEAHDIAAQAAHVLGRFHDSMRGWRKAAALVDESRLDYRTRMQGGVGAALRMLGRIDEAMQVLEDAYDFAIEQDLPYAQAVIGRHVVTTAVILGNQERARQVAIAIGRIAREFGYIPTMLAVKEFFASQEEDPVRAEQQWGAIREEAELVGRYEDAAIALLRIGQLNHERGQLDEAIRKYGESLESSKRLGQLIITTAAQAWRALALAEQGDRAAAEEALAVIVTRNDLARGIVAAARRGLDAPVEPAEGDDHMIRKTCGYADRLHR